MWYSNSFSCASCEGALQKGKRKHPLSEMDNTDSNREASSFKLPVNKRKVRSSVSTCRTSQFYTEADMKLQRFQDAVSKAVKRREQVQGDKTEIVIGQSKPKLSNAEIVQNMEYKAKPGSNLMKIRPTKRDKIPEHTIASSLVVTEKPEDISDHAMASYPFTDDKGR